MPARRFQPPWSVEDNGACFIVRDHGGQKLAYIYYEEEPVAGTKDTTEKYRFNSRCKAFLARTKHVVAAESQLRVARRKAINGGNPNEISPGIRWRKIRAVRHPSEPPDIAQLLGRSAWLISELRMKGPVHGRDAMFVGCKGRQAKGGHANKLFRSIYSFISADFGVDVQRFMHALARGCGLHRARLDLFVRCAAKRRCDQTVATTTLAAA